MSQQSGLPSVCGRQAVLSHAVGCQEEMGHCEEGVTCLMFISDIDDNIWRHADSHSAFVQLHTANFQRGMTQIIMFASPFVVIGGSVL